MWIGSYIPGSDGSASKGGNYSLIYQLGDGGTIIGSLNVSKLNRIS